MNSLRAVIALAVVTAFALIAFCKKPGIPPDKPVIVFGPEHGGINTSYEFAATANHPDDEQVAIRFDWGSGVSDWSSFVPSGDTIRMSNTWTSPGTYAVKARARVEAGAESEWSDPHQVIITLNQPPNTPGMPTGPTSGHKDSTYAFTTIGADPDGDGICYRFDWGNGDTSNWTDWVPSGQPGSASYAWRRSGTFAVRAQAKDVKDALSQWSNQHQVTIPNPNPPNTPAVPQGPTFGWPDSVYSYYSSATDPDGDSVAIRFDWGDGDTSDWSSLVTSGERVTMSHTWRVRGTYQVRAQARDEYGALTGWSNAREVAIGNRAPNAPSRPAGPSTGKPGITYSFSSSATDPDGDRVAIRFAWGNGDTSAWSGFAASGATVTMDRVWGDTGIYRVRAQAKDEEGLLSDWSSSHTIDIRNRPPNAPSRPFGPPYGRSDTSYSFATSAIDPDGDSVSIRFDWGDGDTSDWSSLVRSGQDVRMDHAWRGHGTYHIRAQARDVDGAISVWSAPWTVEIRLKWQYRTGDFVRSSPAIAANGVVYFGSGLSLYALNPDGTGVYPV